MAGRSVVNRYPRRGERIAPATLREFLAEPIPAELLPPEVPVGSLRLCDLDETAWDRFAVPALARLAAQVVKLVGSPQARRVLEHRHFPRPPEGVRLEDLPLESRTRRCLVREGLDDQLGELGDRTIGEVLAIRSFGPRCLVDLLSALESFEARQRRGGIAGLSEALTAQAQRLAELPGAAEARRDDPRFAPLLEAIDPEARNAAQLAEALLARRRDPPDPAYVARQVEQLYRQIAEMSELTIEEELIRIFAAPVPDARNREILIGYYGWQDGRRHTLTEIGKRFGITRERIRQVCAKLTRRSSPARKIPAPAMDRALELIARRLPAPAAELEAELVRQRLTAVGMCLENVAAGAKLLGRPEVFRIVQVPSERGRDSRLAVRPNQVEAVPVVADAARKAVYFHGVATVEGIERHCSEKTSGRVSAELVRRCLPVMEGFVWLDERRGWFRFRQICKHGLPKTIEKILAVAETVEVGQMRAAIARNRRLGKQPPPEEVILEFCRQMPGVKVEGRRISADPPLDWRKVLTGVEARLVEVLERHGPVMERGALEDLCVASGINRFSFHAFVSWSPVIAQYAHSVYGLLGARVSRSKIEALAARQRARRTSHRVLDGHGRTADGRIWLSYRLSRAASTYAVITIPAALKDEVQGRFALIDASGRPVGKLATKDGRAWGLGAFLRRHGAQLDDRIVLTLDLKQRTAEVSWGERPE